MRLPGTSREGGLRSSLDDFAVVLLDDRIELLQVLLNLLANAIDAMEGVERSARRITITTSRLYQGAVVVAVKDCGVGLEAVDMQSDVHALVHDESDGHRRWTLPSSDRSSRAHRGRIWASQNADRGATFSFSLPVGRLPYVHRT